jgi:hypothetical protein
MDTGSERSAVWKSKASKYAELRDRGPLYGLVDWRLVALVPSVRRARTVARAVVAGGGGAFTFLGSHQCARKRPRIFPRALSGSPPWPVRSRRFPLRVWSMTPHPRSAKPISKPDR